MRFFNSLEILFLKLALNFFLYVQDKFWYTETLNQ